MGWWVGYVHLHLMCEIWSWGCVLGGSFRRGKCFLGLMEMHQETFQMLRSSLVTPEGGAACATCCFLPDLLVVPTSTSLLRATVLSDNLQRFCLSSRDLVYTMWKGCTLKDKRLSIHLSAFFCCVLLFCVSHNQISFAFPLCFSLENSDTLCCLFALLKTPIWTFLNG